MFCCDVFVFCRFGCGVAFGFGFCPGCAIEFPTALKKSPTDPALAGVGNAPKAAIARTRTIRIFTLIIGI